MYETKPLYLEDKHLPSDSERTPHNGHSGCTDLGTQHRDGGNPL
ncbi:unnamed protein product [Staurois parvus]|uniref:Uncharacterized protein n=1 Tax=Staurois parvus TaxID=386267 RepID=A0ABN9FP32_9NEOB|nr:unnamed protein product [Staurois parvus]